ncbi:universal stress protein [Paenarthrobacter sp. JL.01a]|uniref:universal stress protein n=1 Tax=Paenarthrobacter sp. JL.01a TaxID=2979324 RepID=UPI0021CA504A|nr:universal stress protein [Paenarthrobacter sp. JL.01a]UXM93493.1 universal stress protein [Paenarthrobacter sp. JL.01a]
MNTARAIAVGYKDSPQSEAALLWAARRASEQKVPLMILHVVDDRWSLNPGAWNGQLRQTGKDLLEAAAAKVGGQDHLHITSELLSGSVAGALGDYGPKCSLLVVGSGSPHLGGALTDRALQIAGASVVPVAVVGTNDVDGKSGVVVGADGSDLSQRAVDFAAAEADREGQELTVVHAYTAPDPVTDAGLAPADLGKLMDEQEHIILAETVAGLNSSYPDLVINKILEPSKEPVRALIDAAAGARLLVLGSRGRGGFARLVLGSTAHGVLTHLVCPTVVVPPQENGD